MVNLKKDVFYLFSHSITKADKTFTQLNGYQKINIINRSIFYTSNKQLTIS